MMHDLIDPIKNYYSLLLILICKRRPQGGAFQATLSKAEGLDGLAKSRAFSMFETSIASHAWQSRVIRDLGAGIARHRSKVYYGVKTRTKKIKLLTLRYQFQMPTDSEK